jgi:hypothetical protein
MSGEKVASDLVLVKALDTAEKMVPSESMLLNEIVEGNMVGVNRWAQ